MEETIIMEINKNNLTTGIYSAVMWIALTLGLDTQIAGTYAPLIAGIGALIITYLLTYLNEKYPSSLITKVFTEAINETTETEPETSDDGI